MFKIFDEPIEAEELLKIPEGQSFDRKSGRIDWKDIGNAIMGFAHADGGVLAIGILKDLKIDGVNNFQIKIEEIKKACSIYVEPPIKINIKLIECETYNKNPSKILLVEVNPHDDFFKNQKGEVFLRIGRDNIKLNHSQIEVLLDEKGKKSYEMFPALGATIEDLDNILLNKYKNILNLPEIEIENLLIGRNLGKKDGGELIINTAGILLFGKEPEKWIARGRIRIIRYEGNTEMSGDELNITKDVNITGPLPYQIEKSFNIINNILRVFSVLDKTGKFISQKEYPDFAWQEAVVNAVIHRSYSLVGADIQIKIFNDHMEIISPGRFPAFVTEKNIEDTHYSKNPQIARVFCELGYVKEIGEGVNRIIKEMRNLNLPNPLFSEKSSAEVVVRLENNIHLRNLDKQVNIEDEIEVEVFSSLNEEERKILTFVLTHKKITNKECVENFHLNRMTALRRLNSLCKKGILKRIGEKGPDIFYEMDGVKIEKNKNIEKMQQQEKLF